jgi:hypothetical protein
MTTTTTTITTDRLVHLAAARRAGLRWRRRAAALLTALVACGAGGGARAGVLVEGTPSAVRVTADRATIAEVLSAVAEKFNATYRTSIALDAPAGPAYAGSSAQVIARLLDGYNYMVKRNGDAAEIVVFGRRGELAIPPPARAAAPAGILQRWR